MPKNSLAPVNVLVNGDMSGDLVGTPINLEFLDNVGIQYVWIGTPTGTIGVQVTNQLINGQPVPNSFTKLTLSGVSEPAGSAGSFWLDINQISAAWIQVYYTHSSGAGTLNVYLSAKAV